MPRGLLTGGPSGRRCAPRASRVARCLALLLLGSWPAVDGCTHPPPAVPSPAAADVGGGPAPGCDAPPAAHEPAGCVDDVPRPPDALPADRPGADRDGDGVEDLLDACPDEPATVDADEDGCEDPLS
jgi:hypothetical protein